VTERVWSSQQRKYLRLVPEALGISARGRSKRLERVLTDFGCEHSFKHAAARVREHYGFEINASAIREATLDNAQRAQQILEKEYDELYAQICEEGGWVDSTQQQTVRDVRQQARLRDASDWNASEGWY